jgi:hypothetical protein
MAANNAIDLVITSLLSLCVIGSFQWTSLTYVVEMS